MKRFKRSYFLIFILLLAGLAAGGYFWLFTNLPAPQEIATRLHTPSIRITDRNGKLLYEALAQDAGRNAVVPLQQIPLKLQQATIATEDSQFYSNPGFDLHGILRAVWLNLRGSQTLVGGSTITQQVARNLLLSAEERSQRSVRRKLREIYLAWQLTRHYSKDEILALYLNQSYYGGMAYGVEAAAQTFFGKSVSELDLAESALLAGLPQTPALYNPLTHPEAAKERQQVVLRRMQEDGYISADERAQADREKLVYATTPYPMQAPHFVMMVRAQLDELFSQEEIYNYGGLVVRTSLDLDWQGHAEQAIAHQIEALKSSPDGLGHNLNNAALVALDPNSGDILALVGSPDYFDAEHAGAINMALAPRQPGSALKPILYATAFDPTRPDPWTAATMLLDVRTTFTTHDGQPYTPANYDLLEHGPVLARQALASSLNIPAPGVESPIRPGRTDGHQHPGRSRQLRSFSGPGGRRSAPARLDCRLRGFRQPGFPGRAARHPAGHRPARRGALQRANNQ
jgi:membrane peptidoglycan carboxypeptidase